IVLALAGDSTITSFLPLVAAISRATLASHPEYAILAAGDASPEALSVLRPDRRPFPPFRLLPVPLPGLRKGEPAGRRGIRPGRRACLEPRPLAARSGPVSGPVPPFHGEIGALLVPARRP